MIAFKLFVICDHRQLIIVMDGSSVLEEIQSFNKKHIGKQIRQGQSQELVNGCRWWIALDIYQYSTGRTPLPTASQAGRIFSLKCCLPTARGLQYLPASQRGPNAINWRRSLPNTKQRWTSYPYTWDRNSCISSEILAEFFSFLPVSRVLPIP